MNANENIGNNIKKWRELKDIKQELLAKRLKITSAALSKIENGKTDITITRIEQIADALEIDFSLLLASPQQILRNTNDLSSHPNLFSHYKTVSDDLLLVMQSELKQKNEQIIFLQNQLQEKFT